MHQATEDLTGISAVVWHESMRPWSEQQAAKVARVPDFVIAQRERLRQRAVGVRSTDEAWFAVPDELRSLLIALCTERDPSRGHMVRWSELNDTEKNTIGVQARSFVRGLGKVAEWLR